MLTLDDARAAFPAFSMALYALEPGGPVTLEIIAPDEESFSFSGPSEAAVIARAFPAPPTTIPEITPEQDIFS